ncbi:hypothetical protein TrRE_jg4609 [Triparma retinervis]|uniref:Uncharacterized protein n=1 Tax=Triparma retinervis TaxID=2557542 RepID=A0A9W6ZNS3_9STRA|nr:hypothetical protein TrRE_jg4609 [Triparma retinervis]
MSLLLETNDKLNSQVESMRANRGMHIDDEQFQIWEVKIKTMQAEVTEKVEENRSLREGVKVKQRRIEELEALLANSKLAKDEMMSMLERERREKEDLLSAGGGEGEEKVDPVRVVTSEAQHNAFAQTEAQPRRSSRHIPPAPTDADVNQMMIMSELDDIRRSLETSGASSSAPTAWSETCSHGVVACLSSVKQRATAFRRELDLLRRQVRSLKEKEKITSERRGGTGKFQQASNNKKEQHSLIKRTSEIVVGPPPVKLLEIGNPGGSISPERVDRMSERVPGAGGNSSGNSSRFSSMNGGGGGGNNNFPQLSNSPLAEVLRRQKDSGGGSQMMSPIQTRDGGGSMRAIRRPSGQGGGKFQSSFRRMSSNGGGGG